jgi:L-seryl-tRNA(Ser) seleniumtransferase
VSEFDAGHLSCLEPKAYLPPNHPPLAGDKAGADDSGDDDEQGGPAEPDRIADSYQQKQLHQRQQYEENQPDHDPDVRHHRARTGTEPKGGNSLAIVEQPPSIDALARSLPDSMPASLRTWVARKAVERSRQDPSIEPSVEAAALAAALESTRQRPVVNATGVILHTNLGRATLADDIGESSLASSVRYTNLELDLDTGSRGGRTSYVTALLKAVTGADDALVVNNNAAALFLTLIAMSSGRSVPVSRGELIEIGGSYRLPDLMASTGTRLVEVGTTNRTRVEDYRERIDETTALILKVHPSNYRIEGFSEGATLSELVDLAHAHGLPAVFDAGSGLIDDRTPWLRGPSPGWLAGEPGIVQSLDAGADLVMFSGDKLLGGPQAGIIVGNGDLIAGLKRHPVTRAMRTDGPTLTALEATLEFYADRRAGELPLWRMATATQDELRVRSESVVASLPRARIVDGASTIGAGSVPGARIPGPVVELSGLGETGYQELLGMDPPIVARREAGDLVLDLRTVRPDEDRHVRAGLERICRL